MTLHQETSLFAVQSELVVTVKFVLPAEELTFWFGGVTKSIGFVPPCVTVTEIGFTPLIETVIVAILEVVSMFSSKEAVIVPSPLPEDVTLHQEASLFAVQSELVVTVKFVLPAEELTFLFGGVTKSIGFVPPCVTVTEIGFTPLTETVIVAILEVVSMFSSKEAVIVPSPLPDDVTLHQVTSLIAVQSEFVVTVKLVFPAEEFTF